MLLSTTERTRAGRFVTMAVANAVLLQKGTEKRPDVVAWMAQPELMVKVD